MLNIRWHISVNGRPTTLIVRFVENYWSSETNRRIPVGIRFITTGEPCDRLPDTLKDTIRSKVRLSQDDHHLGTQWLRAEGSEVDFFEGMFEYLDKHPSFSPIMKEVVRNRKIENMILKRNHFDTPKDMVEAFSFKESGKNTKKSQGKKGVKNENEKSGATFDVSCRKTKVQLRWPWEATKAV